MMKKYRGKVWRIYTTSKKEDFDLFSRIITSGYYVRNIDKSLYLYRADENNYKRRKSKGKYEISYIRI